MRPSRLIAVLRADPRGDTERGTMVLGRRTAALKVGAIAFGASARYARPALHGCGRQACVALIGPLARPERAPHGLNIPSFRGSQRENPESSSARAQARSWIPAPHKARAEVLQRRQCRPRLAQ